MILFLALIFPNKVSTLVCILLPQSDCLLHNNGVEVSTANAK